MIRLKDVIKLIDNSVVFIYCNNKLLHTYDSNDIPDSYYKLEDCRVKYIQHLKHGIKICIYESEVI